MKLGRLEVTIDGARATLAGRIDDSATHLAELAAQLPPGPVSIDTEGVTFVNSIGMREWIRLLRALRERGVVTLERVADVLITQMNLIPDLGGNVRIASFHAQYACNSCGAEVAPLVDAVANAPLLAKLQAPKLPCPECGAQMALADFPERYLTLFKA
jgi:hypothetical protein